MGKHPGSGCERDTYRALGATSQLFLQEGVAVWLRSGQCHIRAKLFMVFWSEPFIYFLRSFQLGLFPSPRWMQRTLEDERETEQRQSRVPLQHTLFYDMSKNLSCIILSHWYFVIAAPTNMLSVCMFLNHFSRIHPNMWCIRNNLENISHEK